MLASLLKYRTHCILALCALLGLACADLAATLAGMRLGRGAAPPAARAAAPGTAAANPEADLAAILQNHLFDPAARTATAPAFSLQRDDAAGATPAVRTDFELVGTLVAGERSIALLRTGQETKLYRLGENLPGGGTLEEVVRHQVTIRNANRSVTTLTMYEGERAAPAARPAAAQAGAGDKVRAAGENRWVIPRAMAASVRDNLGEQLRMALMQPRIINGRTDGFVIKRISPGALLAQMGLQRGDVIKRVNTMTIDSPEKALQILQQLREARQLNVDLERDGKPLSFAYAVE